jgi:hypothetical protein
MSRITRRPLGASAHTEVHSSNDAELTNLMFGQTLSIFHIAPQQYSNFSNYL